MATDVGNRNVRALVGHAEGDVAGAAGHVEDLLARLRFHAANELVLPQPVHPRRHRIVHDVVFARDAGEDLAHAAGLFLRGHILVAERYCLFCHGLGLRWNCAARKGC